MVDNLWYLALAYAVIWAALFAYLAYLVVQARALRKEVQMLTRIIREEVEEQHEPAVEPRIELAAEPKS